MIGIRSTLASFLGSSELDRSIRSVVEEVLAAKGYAQPADMVALREELEALRATQSTPVPAPGGVDPAEVEALRKRLDMAMGALQAATAQIADLRRFVDEARADARQALARAGSALTTAESLADAVSELERAAQLPEQETEPEPVELTERAEGVNINTASVEVLRGLPGVGPSLAARIVEAREEARFNSFADLARVKGLGQATVARLASVLTF
jgi:competence ComEA-like helix-hairpin-helix protein